MASTDGGGWTFLTNHAHVLICIARAPDIRLRDVAAQVGITERAVQSIIGDLERDGYLERVRVGRRNHYRLHADRPMRHRVERNHRVVEMLDALTADGSDPIR